MFLQNRIVTSTSDPNLLQLSSAATLPTILRETDTKGWSTSFLHAAHSALGTACTQIRRMPHVRTSSYRTKQTGPNVKTTNKTKRDQTKQNAQLKPDMEQESRLTNATTTKHNTHQHTHTHINDIQTKPALCLSQTQPATYRGAAVARHMASSIIILSGLCLDR